VHAIIANGRLDMPEPSIDVLTACCAPSPNHGACHGRRLAPHSRNEEGTMGLLDQLLGDVLGQTGSGQQRNQLLDLAVNYVQNYPGGVSGLIQHFTNAGYGAQARSWVGTGPNLPISHDDLGKVLGQSDVQSLGQRVGLPAQATAGGLAALLPILIDQLTPKGQVDDHADLPTALKALRGQLT
jgi:uncharacterized protein YidB (DUF937 family)